MASRLIVGIGEDSAGQECDRTARALAAELDLDPTPFPGGVLFVIGLFAVLLGGAISLLLGGPIALVTDTGTLVATINIVGDAIIQSYTALLATLFFFDLRVRTPRASPTPAVAAL